eukprot:3936092-Prymnesium_polylepis.1
MACFVARSRPAHLSPPSSFLLMRMACNQLEHNAHTLSSHFIVSRLPQQRYGTWFGATCNADEGTGIRRRRDAIAAGWRHALDATTL